MAQGRWRTTRCRIIQRYNHASSASARLECEMRRFLLVSVLLCLGLCGCGSQTHTDPRVREILSAPVPEGVSPVVWRELTTMLADGVRREGAAPPSALQPASDSGRA